MLARGLKCAGGGTLVALILIRYSRKCGLPGAENGSDCSGRRHLIL